jgi:hypothetical protein
MTKFIGFDHLVEIFERSILYDLPTLNYQDPITVLTVERQCAMRNSSPPEQYRVKCLLN